jgi:adenylate cyclase
VGRRTMTAVASADDVRSKGAQAIDSLRRGMSTRLADLIRGDPEWAANAMEVGLVDRAWLEEPGDRPIRTATPSEVMQRFLERSAERRPSVLSSAGLSALQVLSMNRSDSGAEGLPVPVTVVFTDLEGFTRFTSDHGDEAAVTLLNEQQRATGPVIRSRGGRVVKRLGDGLMIAFTQPEAAVLAAVELLQVAPEPLRLRAGVHVGEAVVTRDDVLGHVVNVAARITESAKGGKALASVAVRDAVGDLPAVRFGRARRARLKGVEPMSVCPVEPA